MVPLDFDNLRNLPLGVAVTVLFKNANVFDGSGRAPFDGQVLVSGNRIVEVSDTLSDPHDLGAVEVIDCGQRTLMPGMVESHAHLSWPSSIGRVMNTMSLPPEEHLLVTARNARITLDAGFTSAFSAGAHGRRFEIALRDEIDGGWTPGPRLRASTLEIAPSHDQADTPGAGPGQRDLQAFRAQIRTIAESGVDSIKFQLSGDEAFAAGGSQVVNYTDSEVAVIAEEARRAGVMLACHAQAAESIKLAVRHGFRILYHCIHTDSEAMDLLEANKDQLFVAPAVGMLWARTYEGEEFGITAEVARRMGAPLGIERMQEVIPEMHKRGIRVLPGGDYGFPYCPIGRNARDLEHFVNLFGYTPTEALVAATKLGGELMGKGDLIGQVRPGYLADLLVVNGDPTTNVRVLQEHHNLTHIMKDGAFHKRPSPT